MYINIIIVRMYVHICICTYVHHIHIFIHANTCSTKGEGLEVIGPTVHTATICSVCKLVSKPYSVTYSLSTVHISVLLCDIRTCVASHTLLLL